MDRRELAFIAVERTRMPMVVTDPRQPDNPIVLANRAFLNLTGYTAEELIGRNTRFMQGPETDPAALAQIRDAIREEREITIEMINYRKDGSTFWNQLFVSPVHDDDGQLLYFFGSLMHVSRQREAQALERIERRLLKEVDHRAKNVLAIVQGIVRLSRADSPEQYAHDVQSRVDVLARAHGLLAECRWQDVPLWRVVADEAAHLRAGRVRFDGPEVLLPASAVQPFSLLLHELAMNAEEHGALRTGGEVGIDWRLEDAGNRVSIRWQERGGQPPDTHREPGFGLVMIHSIVERQLGGRMDIDFAPEGFCATMTTRLRGQHR